MKNVDFAKRAYLKKSVRGNNILLTLTKRRKVDFMDIVRRALLGDKKAQEELTEKGKLLPCPFCGNEKNIISNWGL